MLRIPPCALALGLLGVSSVPSLVHELLVELFRSRAELARELLQRVDIDLGPGEATLASTDLGAAVPTEYRADVVVCIRDAGGTRAAVVVEVQLARDPDKRRSWPAYVANLRARLDCPTLLMVVTDQLAVATWAREPIELGHPGFALTPIVIGPAEVPRITDVDLARAAPELALLSVFAHPDLEVARATLTAAGSLDETTRTLYFDVVRSRLPAGSLAALEDQMIDALKVHLAISDRFYERGHEEGLVKGLVQGREEGRDAGREEGRRRLVALARAMAAARLPDGNAAPELERLGDLDDARLSTLILELGTAPNADATTLVRRALT